MNNYHTIRKLGSGTYSNVYLVEKISEKKLYALKKMDLTRFKSTYEKESIINLQCIMQY